MIEPATFYCPKCGDSETGPSTGLRTSEIIWCCPHCDAKFRIDIVFREIKPHGSEKSSSASLGASRGRAT